jgi:hypothetical protein
MQSIVYCERAVTTRDRRKHFASNRLIIASPIGAIILRRKLEFLHSMAISILAGECMV